MSNLEGKNFSANHLLENCEALLSDLPPWEDIEPVIAEINQRFMEYDEHELQEKLRECQVFKKKWGSMRVDLIKRLANLKDHLYE